MPKHHHSKNQNHAGASERRAEADGGVDPTEQHAATGVNALDQGAMSSNTAPPNRITDTPYTDHILRHGVDSLYLSYEGELAPQYEELLELAKAQAQSPDEWEQAMAQIIINDNLFSVSERGRRFFSFSLKNSCFDIAIAKPSAKFGRLAYIQVKSAAITELGLPHLIDELDTLLNTIASDVSNPSVSRIDLFADFTTLHDVRELNNDCFVTRARRSNQYFENGQASGWTVGAGGDISFRLYDKTLELQTSGKDYLKAIWQSAGWNPCDTVWRAEFQLRKPVLKQLNLTNYDQVIAQQAAIWHYATHDWLRIVKPVISDVSRERWPPHPLWLPLQALHWDLDFAPLHRLGHNQLAPHDQSLFINGLGSLTSYMAREGLDTDPQTAFDHFIKDAETYHRKYKLKPLAEYIRLKVRKKQRLYCTKSHLVENHNG